MRRILLSLIVLSSVGLVACAEPEPSILINAHVFRTGAELSDPEAQLDAEGNAVVDADGNAVMVCAPPKFDSCTSIGFDDDAIISTRLFADVSLTAPQVAITMKNQLANTENIAQLGEDNNLRVDTNAIQLQTLVATFSPSGPLKSIGDGGRIEIPLGTLLKSQGNLHLASKLALFKDAEAIASAVQTIAGENGGFVVTSVELQYFGTTLGGNEVVSNILTMPIELCYGCRPAPDFCSPFTAATPICVP